ncbi:hypothetical protein ACSB8C_001347 [Campylobacter jejuni]
MMTDLLDEYIALLEHNLIPFLGISFLFYKAKRISLFRACSLLFL